MKKNLKGFDMLDSLTLTKVTAGIGDGMPQNIHQSLGGKKRKYNMEMSI